MAWCLLHYDKEELGPHNIMFSSSATQLLSKSLYLTVVNYIESL